MEEWRDNCVWNNKRCLFHTASTPFAMPPKAKQTTQDKEEERRMGLHYRMDNLTMICNDANAHDFFFTLRASKPEMTSNSSFWNEPCP
jgi:hypothetical protein